MLSSNFIDQHALGIVATSWLKNTPARDECHEKEDA